MTQRNIGVCIILSIITCGLYGLYWFVVMTDDLKQLSGDTQTASGGMALIFTILSCNIYGWYWAYKRGENVDTIAAANGRPSSNSGIMYIILQALGLGIINYALMQNEINKALGGY